MQKFRCFCFLLDWFCQLTKGRPKHQPYLDKYHPDVTLFYPFGLLLTHTHTTDEDENHNNMMSLDNFIW